MRIVFKLPSICCKSRKTTINKTACFGFTIKIRKLPTAQPIKAPKIGTNAVNAIKIPIKSAYGIFKILSVITNIIPRITASRHCPARKFANVRYVSEHMLRIASAFCFGIEAKITFLTCKCNFSF